MMDVFHHFTPHAYWSRWLNTEAGRSMERLGDVAWAMEDLGAAMVAELLQAGGAHAIR